MLKIAPDDNDGWDTMPEKVEADVKAALKESEKGQVTPNAEIQKRFKKMRVGQFEIDIILLIIGVVKNNGNSHIANSINKQVFLIDPFSPKTIKLIF